MELCLIEYVCVYVKRNICLSVWTRQYLLMKALPELGRWHNQQNVCLAGMRTYVPTLQLGTVACASNLNTEETETESFLGLAGQLVQYNR